LTWRGVQCTSRLSLGATFGAKGASIWRQPLNGLAPVPVASIPGKFIYWIRLLPDRGKL